MKIKTNNSKDIYYVAFLRGINVGGNSIVKMSELKKLFETEGFMNVKTILNSGNVIFTTTKKTSAPVLASALATKLEKALKLSFEKDIHVVIRSGDEIKKMIKKAPFKKVNVTANTRRYVTLLSNASKTAKVDIFNVIELNDKNTTVDLMADAVKKYGKNITTRNWNTIEKIEKLLI